LNKLERNWYTISDLATIWGCTIKDILHFGQSSELEICFDWKKIESKYEGGIQTPISKILFFTVHVVFVEGEEWFFSPQTYKRPQVIDEVSFKEYKPLFSSIRNGDDLDYMLYKPLETLETSIFTRFVAINSELLFDTTSDQISLPYSDDVMLSHRLGSLGDFDFCIFCNEGTNFNQKAPFQLNYNDLIVTKMEKLRFELTLESQVDKTNLKTGLLISNENLAKESVAMKDLLDEEDIPNLLYFAYSLYEQAWKSLPIDMNRPNKPQLSKLLNEMGITAQKTIDSIIKVSTPNNVVLGGKSKSNLKSWTPISKRK
jgi:hypothetical protein